jgi:hypothetical protein
VFLLQQFSSQFADPDFDRSDAFVRTVAHPE